MKKRLFVAVPVSGPLKKVLSKWVKEVVKLNIFATPKIRWTRTNNLHITVCFLGAAEEKNLSGIKKTLTLVAQTTKPFTLSFAGLTLAPASRPKMIWAVLIKSPEFNALVTKVAKSLVVPLLPRRQIVPHVTLARFKGGNPVVKLSPADEAPRANARGIFSAASAERNPPKPKTLRLHPRTERPWFSAKADKVKPFMVANLELWESKTLPTGAVYNLVGRYAILPDSTPHRG